MRQEKTSFKDEFIALKDKKIRAYTIAQTGMYVGGVFASNYATAYLTTTAGISAATAATITLITNIMAFVLAIFGGPLLQSVNLSRGKKDRMHCWLMFTAILFVIGSIGTFFNGSIFGTVGLYMIGCFYIIMMAANTMLVSVMYTLLGTLAGDDIGMRSLLGIWGLRGNKIGGLLMDATAAPLIGVFTAVLGIRWSHAPLGVIFSLITFAGIVVLDKEYLKVLETEKQNQDEKSEKSISFGESLKTIFLNKRYLYMLSVDVFHFAALASLSYGAVYYWRLFGKFESSFAIGTTIVNLASWVFLIISPQIGRRMGKRNAKAFSLAVFAATTIIMTIIGPRSVWQHTIVMLIWQFVYQIWGGFMAPLALDEAERFLYKTGIDMRAVVPAMLMLPNKIGFMIGGAVFTYSLAYIGLDAIDFANLATVTPEFMNKFMLIWMGGTAVCETIAALMWNLGYKMTEKEAAFYIEENHKKWN